EEIRSRVKSDVDQQQREYLLRQQMKAIQEELGESDGTDELDQLRQRAEDKNMPEHALETVMKEIKKLSRINPAAPDYAVTRNYVDWILDVPWTEYSEDHLDINHAEVILEEDHYGLEMVKKRILEYLAVLKLKGDMKAPILCFYGPPGVGKTSLGKSIARALGREFVRMSLGGIRDEAEIRGHRRTYVGALPGRILQGLKKAGTANPVFMLDEVDKLGSDFRGDPSSALLEVLDPEQNHAFNDHYIELDYDLSKVLFIATANFLGMIPSPLRDRMELIEITGYTQDEKLAIAKGFLVPRQTERNGLQPDQFSISDEALSEIIDGYTRESGVRQLERTIGAVARGVAKKIAVDEVETETVQDDELESYLGARKFFSDIAERTEVPGVATGLAWTPVGGDILFIEVSASRGSGRMTLTGQLGDVMKESAQAALSYVKSRADELGIPQDAFRYWDLHVHVPAGAVPKDGPSAGVTMLTALVSIYTQRRVKHDLAMTGEITLRGLVLPVGGIKEKVLAAKRAGIKRVLLPWKNEKDIKEIKSEALDGLEITYLKRMEEATELALWKKPVTDPVKLFTIPESEKRPYQAPPNGAGA
ncbi:MAG: endopeptidase La, partial [Rhodothermales bacterium]